MRILISSYICFGLVAQVLCQEIPTYWYEYIKKQGVSPYNPQGSAYQVYRNVKTYGAKGDGVTDDTAAIQKAIADGSRCAPGVPGVGCQSSTTSPAVVYFPAGTYLISSPIVMYYMTNLIGNPHNPLPVLKASASFPASAIALVDGDEYTSADPTYGTTNVFYRQVRNLVFDLTATPPKNLVRAIHWPTAQATSLQNCVFKMSTAVGTQHVGVFIENGSGGLLNDLIFYGGNHGMEVGSQQFTSRNLTFYNSATAIYHGFDWGWTYSGLSINNCTTGIDMSNGGTTGQLIGSMVIIDSTFTNTPLGILTSRPTSPSTAAGSLALENVIFTNVPAAIKGPTSIYLAGNSGTITTTGWVQGNVYSPSGPTKYASAVNSFIRPAGLVSGTRYYARSKPQYQNIQSASFMSVRTGGAKGDGVTDDTTAIQNVINSATSAGKIVYFDAGIYKVTTSINIGPGARIVGEAYPVIMASGSLWSDANNPIPVLSVGSATTSQTGVVELSDFIVSTQGAMAGAVLIQWNLASPASTPSGMWDVHTRIGGFQGSNLQVADCPITGTQPKAACIAASQSMKISNIANGLYVENAWLWTADHDLDDVNNNNTRISVYSGRGLSVESTTGNIWLVGTAVEHHSLYQYQLANTKNIFMGFMQTETPYYQPSPNAQIPFSPIAARDDPNFATFCAGKAASCNMAWGLRVLNSTAINVYGAGLYSFFQNYDTTCSNHTATVYNEYCQTQILGIDEGGASGQTYGGSTFYVYGLNTVGSVSMLDRGGSSIIAQSANTNAFASSVIRFVVKVPGT